MKNAIIKKIHKAYIKGDNKRLIAIQSRYAPNSLIKFCNGKYDEKGNNDYLNSLRNGELWLSSPAAFNDPFDSLHHIGCEELAKKIFDDLVFKEFKYKKPKYINYKEKEKLIISWTNRYKNTFEHIKNNTYMTCFSEKTSLISDSMWSYYANCHKGFCVEYDFATLSKCSIMPVLYTKKYRMLNAVTNNVREFSCGITFNKAIEWKHEKEWRIVSSSMIDTKEQLGMYIPIDKPTAIYLGCLTSEQLRNDMIDICKMRRMNLYEMYLMPNTFKMNYRQISI